MVEEADALARILQAAEALPVEKRSLAEVRGFFLGETLRARLRHPRFDNSSMDGYAIRAEDGLLPRRIVGEQAAGRTRDLALGAGEAVRIFTGAAVPAGCTAVVMQEDVEVADGILRLLEPVEVGENIRRAGADVAEGQTLGARGGRVTPQLIGLLASQGFGEIPVHRAPRVTILSTGDELRPAGETLADGEIYESNGPMLAALVTALGVPARTRCLRDDLALITREIATALEEADVVLLSGGVSVGDRDYVRPALAALGISLDLWRIRMKPGKPLAFAQAGGKLIFGLPGNPVSAFVTFLMLVRPAFLKMLGAGEKDLLLPRVNLEMARDVANPGDRPHYLRGGIADGQFTTSGLQESHALFGLSRSQCLLRLEPGERLRAGERHDVFVW